MQEQLTLKPKGRVKVELYNDKGVFYSEERKNLIVLSANKIVANMMSDPNKKTRIKTKEVKNTSTSPNENGHFVLQLDQKREAVKTYEVDLGSDNNQSVITIPNARRLTALLSVTVNSDNLVINEDVFIRDAENGVIEFKHLPTGVVQIKYQYIENPYVEIVEGTEIVKVGNQTYTRSNTPLDSQNTYAFNPKTGELYFQTAKSNVEVTYDYQVFYGLAFMGIGGKPDGHPDDVPVQFSDSDKPKKTMENEFPNSRQLIKYPAYITDGTPEIEVLPTKPIEYSVAAPHIIKGDGSTTVFTLPKPEGKRVLELTFAKNLTTEEDLVIGSDIELVDGNEGTVRFLVAPEEDEEIEVRYNIQENNNHLVYTLSEAPILELVSIKHEALDNKVTEYHIVNGGLSMGQGDVWIMNANRGIIQFSANPQGKDPSNPELKPAPVHTPGQLTIEYKTNSGTVVQYVADFPAGVPGPVEVNETEVISVNSSQTSYPLRYPVAKDENENFKIRITLNGNELTMGESADYTLSQDGMYVHFNLMLQPTDNVIAEYKWINETHKVYQVAMFTDKEGGEMFNISGLGPITKDKNTGMRITWSVTI